MQNANHLDILLSGEATFKKKKKKISAYIYEML